MDVKDVVAAVLCPPGKTAIRTTQQTNSSRLPVHDAAAAITDDAANNSLYTMSKRCQNGRRMFLRTL